MKYHITYNTYEVLLLDNFGFVYEKILALNIIQANKIAYDIRNSNGKKANIIRTRILQENTEID